MDIVTYVLCKNLAKSAISGISNIQVDGTNLIITTTDGNTLTMEFPVPADGLSIQGVTINNDNHLICTMSDGSTIDAGKLPDGTGGMEQYNRVSQFPREGKEDTLYLAKEDEKLYYWNGTSYQAITPDATEVLAELETAEIVFDGINNTFDLPIDKVKYNVYVNGLYLTQGFDYTIDNSLSPNKIVFDTVYDISDKCMLTYLKATKPSADMISYATDANIDTLFPEGGTTV